jgi:phosphatidylglycerol lysyltransferase
MNPTNSQHARLWTIASIVLFTLALFALHRLFGEFSFAQLQTEISALRKIDLLCSVLAALTSYALLTGFDVIGVRLSGKDVPIALVAQTAFIANAFAHTLGMATLTGGAVRARGYASAGLKLSALF